MSPSTARGHATERQAEGVVRRPPPGPVGTLPHRRREPERRRRSGAALQGAWRRRRSPSAAADIAEGRRPPVRRRRAVEVTGRGIGSPAPFVSRVRGAARAFAAARARLSVPTPHRRPRGEGRWRRRASSPRSMRRASPSVAGHLHRSTPSSAPRRRPSSTNSATFANIRPATSATKVIYGKASRTASRTGSRRRLVRTSRCAELTGENLFPGHWGGGAPRLSAPAQLLGRSPIPRPRLSQRAPYPRSCTSPRAGRRGAGAHRIASSSSVMRGAARCLVRSGGDPPRRPARDPASFRCLAARELGLVALAVVRLRRSVGARPGRPRVSSTRPPAAAATVRTLPYGPRRRRRPSAPQTIAIRGLARPAMERRNDRDVPIGEPRATADAGRRPRSCRESERH